MRTLTHHDFAPVLANIARITGKTPPDITLRLYDNPHALVAAVYGDTDPAYIPDFVRVFIDYEQHIISTCDPAYSNLYLLFVVCGPCNNMHKEWHDLLSCYAQYNFCPADDIAVDNSLPFPQLLFACNQTYAAAKARLFATLLAQHGFDKMLQWLEAPDLLYYYQPVFGTDCEAHIQPHDISHYQAVLNGTAEADENTRLALWIDDPYRADSTLDVFYSTPTLTKAAIRYQNRHVLGIVNIYNDHLISYVTDYSAWERRRAEGYTRNNPYNEAEFMTNILSYTTEPRPKILEICIGGGRKAKPFVENGYEYHGIDISDAMLAECTANLGTYPNLHTKNHNIFDGLPYPDNSFDLVIECRVAFAENHPFVMQEIHRVLRPGGTAFLGMGDNHEVWGKHSRTYKEQHQLLWGLYKPAYFSHYNITDQRTVPQPTYHLALPQPPAKPCPPSQYQPPQPIAAFTAQQPFSTHAYTHDHVKECKDNQYHMAFFRTEPMYEPCGTDFFAALEKAAASFNESGICTRITEVNVYRFD